MSVTYKVGDRLPVLTATLRDANGPVDISDAQHVQLTLRREGSEQTFMHVEAAIDDGENGRVRYEWQDDDLDKSGTFQLEWLVTWPSGESMTFPNNTYGTLVVSSRLSN